MKASITVKNKIYSYSLDKKGNVIRVVCRGAALDQDFLVEDVAQLLIDLPALIISEQKDHRKNEGVIRFRVSSKDKEVIEKKAFSKGYKSVSEYVRDAALAK
jgi:hypothetical protein